MIFIFLLRFLNTVCANDYNNYFIELHYSKWIGAYEVGTKKIIDENFFSFEKKFKQQVFALEHKRKKNKQIDPSGLLYLDWQEQIYKLSYDRLVNIQKKIEKIQKGLMDAHPLEKRNWGDFYEYLSITIPDVNKDMVNNWRQWRIKELYSKTKNIWDPKKFLPTLRQLQKNHLIVIQKIKSYKDMVERTYAQSKGFQIIDDLSNNLLF